MYFFRANISCLQLVNAVCSACSKLVLSFFQTCVSFLFMSLLTNAFEESRHFFNLCNMTSH